MLRRLATEDGQLRLVARKALEILHFDPDTGEDRHRAEHAIEDCAQACYDCLLSYSNQWDHQHLDRHSVTDLLRDLMPRQRRRRRRWRRARRAAGTAERARTTASRSSSWRCSRSTVTGCPTTPNKIVDGYYVRPDFAYHTGGMDVAVFIDGPIHDTESSAARRTSKPG